MNDEFNVDALADALTRAIPPLLQTMAAFQQAGRYLHPQFVPRLAELISQFDIPLEEAQAAFESVTWPDNYADVAGALGGSLEHARAGLDGFVMGAVENDMMACFRALRKQTRCVEALYPLAADLKPVSQFFLEEPLRTDADVLERVSVHGGEANGIIHVDNSLDERGGYSLYIPEYRDPAEPVPLIVALHGGSGHGADFLWTWLREARSRNCVVMSPTSADRTWSITGGPDVDVKPMKDRVSRLVETLNIDREKVLLTGMSDGATYSLVCGLQPEMPFTHFAPISGVLHPDNTMNGNLTRVVGKPVYLVHGELDWMFPIETAQMARDQLYAAGADLEYRQIEDLSHTYPREENARILDWMSGSP